MSISIHVAFIIGLLLLLTKVADFIFLPNQKLAIENGFKSFYTYVKGINPTKWIAFLKDEDTRLILATIGCLLLFGFLAFRFWSEIVAFWNLTKGSRVLFYFSWVSIVWGVKFINLILGEDTWGDIPDWLSFSENAYHLAFKYIVIIILYALYNIIIYYLLRFFIDGPFSNSSVVSFGGIVILSLLSLLTSIFCLYIVWLLIMFFPIFLFSIFLILLSFCCYIIKIVSVRVLAYNKGIFPGLVLVATTILGVLEFLMKK